MVVSSTLQLRPTRRWTAAENVPCRPVPQGRDPSQVFVAALRVVVPFLFAAAGTLGIHQATVAGEMSRTLKAADLSDFDPKGHAQDLSYPW